VSSRAKQRQRRRAAAPPSQPAEALPASLHEAIVDWADRLSQGHLGTRTELARLVQAWFPSPPTGTDAVHLAAWLVCEIERGRQKDADQGSQLALERALALLLHDHSSVKLGSAHFLGDLQQRGVPIPGCLARAAIDFALTLVPDDYGVRAALDYVGERVLRETFTREWDEQGWRSAVRVQANGVAALSIYTRRVRGLDETRRRFLALQAAASGEWMPTVWRAALEDLERTGMDDPMLSVPAAAEAALLGFMERHQGDAAADEEEGGPGGSDPGPDKLC
jgi:hypothetical protein